MLSKHLYMLPDNIMYMECMGHFKPAHGAVILSVLFVIAISGCISADPATFARLNPMVQEFLEEHPNAEITVTHYTAAEAGAIIDQIADTCQKETVEAKEYYRITIEDDTSGLKVTAWVDWENQLIECALKTGGAPDDPSLNETECKPRYKVRCFEGNAYWFDSCGNRGEKKEACGNGCDSGRCIGHDLCKNKGGYCSYTGLVEEAVISGDVAEIIASTSTATDALTGMVHAVTANNKAPTASSGGGGGSGGSCSRFYICPNGERVKYCEMVKLETPISCVESNVTGAGKVCSAGSVTVSCICTENPELLCKNEDNVCRAGYEKSRFWCPDNGVCCMPDKNECKPDAEARCYGGHVYWYDSCGNRLRKREYCRYGCDDGRCKEPPIEEKCYDTDGGYNIYEKGVVESGNQRLEDHCNSDGTLTEKFCADDKTINWNSTACPDGYVCNDGACMIPPSEMECGDGICGEAYTVSLKKGEEYTATVNGISYYIALLGFTSINSDEYVIVQVDDVSDEIKEQSSRIIGGLLVYPLSVIYAGEDSDINSAQLILGETTRTCPEDCADGSCEDSDGGMDIWEKGTAIGRVWEDDDDITERTDYCVQTEGAAEELDSCSGELCGVYEFECKNLDSSLPYVDGNIYECPYGCVDGACIEPNATVTCYNDEDCGGITTTVECKGEELCTSIVTNTCVDAGTPESACTASAGVSCVACEHGCEDGACIEIETSCVDTDDGLDYYTDGDVTVNLASGGILTVSELCLSDLVNLSIYYPTYQTLLNSMIDYGLINSSHLNDSSILLEAYCPQEFDSVSNPFVFQKAYSCPGGCSGQYGTGAESTGSCI